MKESYPRQSGKLVHQILTEVHKRTYELIALDLIEIFKKLKLIFTSQFLFKLFSFCFHVVEREKTIRTI